ncbi:MULTISPECIES: sugar MFS transporter [Actinomadura]|uniref:MFS transporter n=1 Tax=Actinomadura litoris TaxID=2678616 RepID=A0A7K1L8S7_9ACTN|nr:MULTISPECIES: MFS transporter [Actinomadura]MBT2212953.1 MFS transporter [Actinomadura sp. NEAU-AAG7]MUN40829.1 MFS transporter [Actinomadura litoris]
MTPTATPTARGTARTAGTLGLYAAFGCLGYLLTGIGAILPELRAERGLPRAEAALYSSAFALGLVVVGLVGHRLAVRLGRHAIPTALAALVSGATVMAVSGGRLGVGFGALLTGLGGAGLVQVVPSALRAVHGGEATVPIGEANAVSSAGSVLAPPIIGMALAHGLGWRAAFAIPPLALGAALLLTRSVVIPAQPATPTEEAKAPTEAADEPERRPQGVSFFGRWCDLVLAVGVEFCMVFWAADFLHHVKGLGSGTATTLSAAFVLGMASGRVASGPVVRAVRRPDRILALAALLALAGFAALWTVPAPFAVAGLLVMGLGVALLYPVILSEALAAWPTRPVQAAGRCALASGVAIGTAPLFLGALADATTLRTAVFVAPALLLILLSRCGRRLSATD